MKAAIQLGDVAVDLVFKDIKNLHLSVYPPTGHVRVSAPLHANINTIRAFLISKLGWIRQNQGKLVQQERESPREYLDRESHYLWGKRYLLDICLTEGNQFLKLGHRKFHIGVARESSQSDVAALMDDFYRGELRDATQGLRAKWEKILEIEVKRIFIQRMKTRWGSCNPQKGNIRLNLELAKKPESCLEFIFLHEAIHFLEPNHGERFIALMNTYLPNWRVIRQLLNEEPLAHMDWKY